MTTSQAFLVFSARADNNSPVNAHVSGQITNSTTLTFSRSGTAGAITIEWYVAEFTSGVSVQRGSANQTATTVNVTLTSVTTSKSFPLVTHRTTGSTFSANDFPRAKITSSTNLELTVDSSDAGGYTEWQVVEYTDSSVQTGDVSFLTTDSSKTATITSASTTKSWLIYTYKTADGTAADIGQKLVRGALTNSTTLTFDRDNTGQTIDVTWFLVEFTDGTTVQKGSQSFTSSETQKDVTINNVDTTWAIAAGGHFLRGGKSPYSADDNPGVGWFTLDLTSSTNLQITRALTGSVAADAGWFVVQFVANSTVVGLASFTAEERRDGVLLEWRTGREVDNLGFHVYREADGRIARLTSSLVAGSALVSGTPPTAARSYAFWDLEPPPGASLRYWIEDVDLNGTRTDHEPISPSPPWNRLDSPPPSSCLTGLGGTGPRKRKEAPVRLSGRRRRGVENSAEERMALQFALAARPAAKVSVRNEGWYRVARSDLIAAGLDPNLNPRFLRLFVDGDEVSLLVRGGRDGRLGPRDTVEFFGSGRETPSTDARVYWIADGNSPGRRIRHVRGSGRSSGARSFPFTVEVRGRTIYFAGLKNGDGENFFGQVVSSEPAEESIIVHHMDPSATAEPFIEAAFQGVTEAEHAIEVLINGSPIGEASFSGQAREVFRFPVPRPWLRDGENVVKLAASGGEGDVSLIESIRLTYHHTYTADDDSLRFTVKKEGELLVSGFDSSTVRVVEIDSANEPRIVRSTVRREGNGYSATIAAPGPGVFLAQGEGRFEKPDAIEPNLPSRWNGSENGADLVIIAHEDFVEALTPLKIRRQDQGWTVSLVSIQDVYDEFNFGAKSPQALKDFLGWASARWTTTPRFVLLGGDASFDPKNHLGLGVVDLVPTKLLETAFLETASDDWFADFDEDALPEMAVGRLPARTPREMNAMVAKLIAHDEADRGAAWRKNVLLVADEGDVFDFEGAVASLKEFLPPAMAVQEVVRAPLGDAETRRRLLDGIERGQALVNYMGHGSVEVWRGDILTSEDARSLRNGPRLPLFVAMSCLNGFFHDVHTESLAEALLKAEIGGAVAVWTSSGLTAPAEQANLNREFLRLLFEPDEHFTIGEAAMRAKAATASRDIRRTWILFGDPTSRIE